MTDNSNGFLDAHCIPDGSKPGQPNPMFLDKNGKSTTTVPAGEPFTVAVRMATATTTGCPPGTHPDPVITPPDRVHPTPVSTVNRFHMHLDADLVLTSINNGDGLTLDAEQLKAVLTTSHQVVHHEMQTRPDIPHDTDVTVTVTDSDGNNPQSNTLTIKKQP